MDQYKNIFLSSTTRDFISELFLWCLSKLKCWSFFESPVESVEDKVSTPLIPNLFNVSNNHSVSIVGKPVVHERETNPMSN